MKIEHFAIQVADPLAMAAWYVKHLGCTIARSGGEPAHMQFLKDSSGSVMIEIYRNPRVAVPDYAAMDPLLVHLAFLSENPAVDRDRLVAAGARVVDDLVTTPLGDQLIMLRDPWNTALQLIKRAAPMLR
jgi:catechol 2,3-dioxygenase-like lactoylglutathione lyase family enzyme